MNKWWGYRHADGSIQVKRFFDYEDINEARASDFVNKVYGVFEAIDREDAIKKLEDLMNP